MAATPPGSKNLPPDGGLLAGSEAPMTEAEWLACRDPAPMLELLRGKASDRRTRLFACACLREAWTEGMNPAPLEVIEQTEALADGRVSKAKYRAAAGSLRVDDIRSTSEADRTVEWSVIYAAQRIGTPKNYLNVVPYIGKVLALWRTGQRVTSQTDLLRDIFGNPFQSIAFDPRWRTADALGLARAVYEDRAFDRLPLLADALMDAGCADEQVLSHCRGPGPHARGCWVVDLVLGKE
jgi:hypothetical protein